MAKFAILDTNAGLLQWVGEGETPRDVLAQFDAKVGINPHGMDMDEVANEFVAYAITDADEAALDAWATSGSRGDAFPLEGRTRLAA